MTSRPTRSFLAGSLLYGCVLANALVTVLLRFTVHGATFRPTWVVLMPVVQIVLGIGILFWCGRTRSLVIHILATTFAAIAWGVLHIVGHPERFVFGGLDGAVHLVSPFAWIFAVAGVLGVPWWLRRRRLGFLRAWLAVSVFLCAAELGSRWLEFSTRGRDPFALELPKDFPDARADEAIHIAAIGGSSTLGHPYQPHFGFPQVFLWRLEQLYPGRKFKLHNLAQGGYNLRRAAGELNRLPSRPDLLLIYAGHNEFYHDTEEMGQARLPWDAVDPWMRWSALFRRMDAWTTERRQAWEFRLGERQLFDRALMSEDVLASRRARFKSQCAELSRFCKEHEITPVWFVPAASESGFEPNRSLKPDGLSQTEADRFAREFYEMRERDCGSAIAWYRGVLERMPDFAEFHFHLARCLEQTGECEAARGHYGRALDCDGFPVRVQAEYRDAIRQTAEDANAVCVETGEILRQHAPNGILDTSLFHDDVHMTLKGYYLTGLAGAEALVQSRILEATLGRPQTVAPLDLQEAIGRSGIGREQLAHAYRLTAYGFEELKRWRYDRAFRERRRLEYQELAESLAEGQIDPEEIVAEPLPSPVAP